MQLKMKNMANLERSKTEKLSSQSNIDDHRKGLKKMIGSLLSGSAYRTNAKLENFDEIFEAQNNAMGSPGSQRLYTTGNHAHLTPREA
jgi:hypothetical protein